MVVVNRMRYGQTVIQNAFIDSYLASANGEYVKVYIMLLRLMDEENLSLSRLADALDITEKDVIRALSYWEKQGLVSLVYDSGRLAELVMMDLPIDKRSRNTADGPLITFTKSAADKPKKVSKLAPLKPSKSAAQILSVDGKFSQLLFVMEQYLGRQLSKTDMDLFVWLYDEQHFSGELIEFLVEYCVALGKTSNRYIRTVAENWKASGIDTVDKAKKQIKAFSENKQKGNATSGNKFHNFDQRNTDLDALVDEEIKHGAS